ncbi:MAG: transcriptional regulator with XRE-family HTH domain [Candidatus Endobugula sp.]|jgi:transcriptional regulator with XRE-family HTH domain
MKHPDFAERFTQAVTLSGVETTQKALGKLLGVSEVMIWSYRNGEKLPRMAMALHMAEVFGVSIDWLLQGRGQPIYYAVKEDSPEYHTQPLRKSTQDIADFVEGLSEVERKKALQILELTFSSQH